ncbi:4-alpha-glucanotransferase [Rhodobacteraceae bacterium CCMM004]|nr:4-alpha-glucanotransferase [Rhodobacteraceae bacterium CCMM004]
MSQALDDLAEAAGILPSYVDQMEARRVTPPETKRALLAAMGIDASTDRAAAGALAGRPVRRLPRWAVCVPGAETEIAGLSGDWTLRCEDGSAREGAGARVPGLPLGIHGLRSAGETCWLLAAPPRLPDPPRSWGVTLPLYGLLGDGPVGSYRDLAHAVASLGAAGAGFVGINPIHAGFPTDPTAYSPYSPSSRRRLSTLHIAAGADPGAGGDLVDYAHAVPAQRAALRALWEAEGPPPDLDDWIEGQGPTLARFALHQALSDRFVPYWPDWPEAYRSPDSPAVARFGAEAAGEVRFHAWAQWLAERQLAEVSQAAAPMALGLYLDLAVGVHPQGAETWAEPDLYARAVSLGAPPDGFAPEGQTWGLAPLRPDALIAAGFAPLAEILRAQLAHAKLLRIDHILGFERAFWVPQDAPGVPGAYVAMPKSAMLAVARIEAARAGATIVGEDLGNIPEGLQDDLEASGLLGCRVVMFEQEGKGAKRRFTPPEDYDAQTLTSFSTHDLPTYLGWRAGRELTWWHRVSGHSDDWLATARAEREKDVARLDAAGGGPDRDRLIAFLARTPARLVAVQIEDLLDLTEQPNLPGTIYEHPNWRRRIGVDPARLGALPALRTTTAIMARHLR